MQNKESQPEPEYQLGQHIEIYTPNALKELDSLGMRKFQASAKLLRASIKELQDINGIKRTNRTLQGRRIIYPKSTPTVPTLRSWDYMLTHFTDRTPFLISLEQERDDEVIAVCEGRIYPFRYNRDEVKVGTEPPIEEKAIFIEQTGVKPKYRGNKENNAADALYNELYSLAAREAVTLLIGAVNKNNGISRSVVERWGRKHVDIPPLDRDPERFWPHPDGAYLPNPEWEDTDKMGNPIHVVLEYFTQRLGDMPRI